MLCCYVGGMFMVYMHQGNFAAGCVVPSGSRWMQSSSSAISSTGRFQVSPGRPVIWFNPLLDCDVDKKDCWYMRQISAQIHTRYMVFSSHLRTAQAQSVVPTIFVGALFWWHFAMPPFTHNLHMRASNSKKTTPSLTG